MDLLEITKIDWKKSIVRSNDYTAATYSLSPDAHRIISVAISAIAQNDLKFTTYRIYVPELITFFPALHSDKNAIARIDKATDSLMWSYIKIKQKNGWLKRNLVHSCLFNKNSGHPYVDIKLDDDMLPHLISVNSYFSSPKLENIRLFKKDQHFKLHAYFYSFLYRHSTGIVSIDDLRKILDVDKKQYKLVGHLKSRLLLPSIDLINNVTDIHISIKDVKHWRKIAGFIFNIAKRPPLPIISDTPDASCNIEQSIDLQKEYLALWISRPDFTILLKKHSQAYLEQLLIYVNHKKSQIKIDSVKNYIFGILNKKPTLDELLTPSCLIKAQNSKRIIQESHNRQIINEKQNDKDKQANKVTLEIKNYLAKKSKDQLCEIRAVFNNSLFASGLKFGQESVDFDKPIVEATFYNFVHIKYIGSISKE